jgi:dihydroorotase
MSKIIIHSARVADSKSPFNGKEVDILIENGMITEIGSSIAAQGENIQAKGAFITPGWVDVFARCGEPGEEWKEDLNSLASAAHAGGFTAVAAYCGSQPVPDNGAAIQSVLNKCADLPVRILPLGDFVKPDGNEMAELFDMQNSGAAGFAHPDHPISDSGFISRLLDYARSLEAPVILEAFDKKLAPGGRMHEGSVAASLGLKGIPSVSESIALKQIIDIAHWLNTRLHIYKISTAESVEIIKAAKNAGQSLCAAVPVYNLLFTEQDLDGFDENHKVLPPYRTLADRKALIEGLLNGHIDAVMSNHHPQDIENKAVEFEYAAWGASSVQTVLNVLLSLEGLTAEKICDVLAHGPRRFLNMPELSIAVGQKADLTIFDAESTLIFNNNNLSKGVNHPLKGKELKGVVLGTVLNGTWNPVNVSAAGV